jgi:C-terminal processing protease CtpA/Prc
MAEGRVDGKSALEYAGSGAVAEQDAAVQIIVRFMKSILPWALVAVLAICCGRLYLSDQKIGPPQGTVSTNATEASAHAEAKPELAGEAERAELLQLRQERADLLRLRNEVRQLREQKGELEARVKSVSRELKVQAAREKIALQGRQPEFRRADSAPRALTGIGVMLVQSSTTNGPMEVRQVMAGSPAARAGLTQGVRLLSVNGISMANATIEQWVEALRGDEGTQVLLEYEDPEHGLAKRGVMLTREKIPLTNPSTASQ